MLKQTKSYIVKNAIANTLDALLGGIDFLQGSPAVFHHLALLVGQLTSGCQCSQLLVNFLLVGKLLFYVAVFVLQVEDNLVFHGLFVQILVDIRAKGALRHALDTVIHITFVFLQKRCASKTDEHNLLAHDGTHGFMQATALCAVAFINENKDVVPLNAKVVAVFLGDDGLQFFKVFVQTDLCTRLVFLCFILRSVCTELVDERADEPFFTLVKRIKQVAA